LKIPTSPSCTSSTLRSPDGAVVEVLDRLRRALGLRAAHRELRAAACDGDVERRFDLPQVLVERAAQPREPLVVDRIQLYFDRFGPQRSSPSRVCERAAVILTSTKPSLRAMRPES
jgi:hypothetical protein